MVIVLFLDCSGSEQDQMLSGIGIIWPAMMITSTAFQAVASVLKVMPKPYSS